MALLSRFCPPHTACGMRTDPEYKTARITGRGTGIEDREARNTGGFVDPQFFFWGVRSFTQTPPPPSIESGFGAVPRIEGRPAVSRVQPRPDPPVPPAQGPAPRPSSLPAHPASNWSQTTRKAPCWHVFCALPRHSPFSTRPTKDEPRNTV